MYQVYPYILSQGWSIERNQTLIANWINRNQSNANQFDWYSIAFKNWTPVKFLQFFFIQLIWLCLIVFDCFRLNLISSIGHNQRQSYAMNCNRTQSNLYTLSVFDWCSIGFGNRIPIIQLAFDWIWLIQQSNFLIDHYWTISGVGKKARFKKLFALDISYDIVVPMNLQNDVFFGGDIIQTQVARFE